MQCLLTIEILGDAGAEILNLNGACSYKSVASSPGESGKNSGTEGLAQQRKRLPGSARS